MSPEQQESRDETLGGARQAAHPGESPAPWQNQRQFQDLADAFTQALTAAGGEVWRAANWEEAVARLDALWAELGAHKVVANVEPPLPTLDPATRWPHLDWRWATPATPDWREQCAQADVGVTSASAALAETGTMVVSSGPGCSRLTPLLPPVHVALVPTRCLTTNLFTWVATRQGPPPPATTLISGPSKTADIEQTMAVGVHGPKRLIVVLW